MTSGRALNPLEHDERRLVMAAAGERVRRLFQLGRELVEVAHKHYIAVHTYEQLSRLSDAELSRRGLTRWTLAWSVIDACSGDTAKPGARPVSRTKSPEEATFGPAS